MPQHTLRIANSSHPRLVTETSFRPPPPYGVASDEGGNILWICDPMHGNTHTTSSGVKTRSFEDIRSEVELAFEIHRGPEPAGE